MDDKDIIAQQVVGVNPLISVVKTADLRNADGSDDLDDVIDSAGDTILYTVSVSNVGDTDLTGVELADPFIADTLDKNSDGLINSQDIIAGDNGNGVLEIGETWTWSGSYQVTQEDINNRGNYDSPVDPDEVNDNLIRNTVFVGTAEGAEEDAEVDVTLDYDPQVRVLKTADVVNGDGSDDLDEVIDTAGDIVKYTVTATNIGNVSLNNFELTDSLPGLSFDTNSDGVVNVEDAVSGDLNGNGVLDVGEEWLFQGEYEISQADIDSRGNYDGTDGDSINDSVLRNGVSVTTQTIDQNISGADDVFTEIDYRPVILLQKTGVLYNTDDSLDEDGAIDTAGEVIKYQLNVQNAGNVTLSDVVVVDPLTGASMDKNEDGVIDILDSDGGDDNGNGLLDVGETWVFSSEYQVKQADIDSRGNYDGPDPGTINDNIIRNFGGVTSLSTDGQQVTRDTFVDTRIVDIPVLTIDKVFLNVTGGNGNEVADADGDVLNYRVVVTNAGNITLTDVSVTDPLTGQAITGVSLAPGESQEFLSSYTLTQADLDGQGGGDGDVDNTATADSAQTDSVQASAQVPLAYSPELTIDKTADVESVDQVGDVINYTIAVSNTGNITLTNVEVTDTLIEDSLMPRDLDLNGVIDGDGDADGELDVGETWYWVGQYQVTAADYEAAMASVNPYFIQNTATADSNETDPESDSEEVELSAEFMYEGLSPGYWKNHPEDWDGLSTSASFEQFFFGSSQPGLNWKVKIVNGGGKEKFSTQQDITLMQALELTGGDSAALARQAVAAVLNSRDEDVSYRFTEAQIKEWVTEALTGQPVDLENDGTIEFAGGSAAIQGVKDLLDYNNNLELA